MEILERLKHDGRQVALILAAAFLPGMDGTDFLARAHHLFPTAKRGLLIDWGDTSTSDPVRRAMALGHIDFFVQKPLGSREENFHRAISELLEEWAYSQGLGVEAIRIVGERWSQRSQEMRSLLERYGVPFTFVLAGAPEGRRLLAEVGVSGQRLPVLVLFDGRVLVDPEYFEVADAFGASVEIGGGAKTSPSSALDLRDSPPRYTAPRKAWTPWFWTRKRSAGRPVRVPASAIISASREGWAVVSWHNGRTYRRGCSVRDSTSLGR